MGVCGFSEGATLASILLKLSHIQPSQYDSWHCLSWEHIQSFQSLRFGILASGDMFLDRLNFSTSEILTSLPTIHFMSPQDNAVPIDVSEALARCFSGAKVLSLSKH